MPDSYFSTAGQAGDLRIGITTENELAYWLKTLRCTEPKLLEAISVVGN